MPNFPSSTAPQNPFEQLRLQQIFGGTRPSPAPMASTLMDPMINEPVLGPAMGAGQPEPMRGYQSETGASDRFNEMLGAYPEDRKRGWLENIALSMIAAGDPRLSASLMDQPSREQTAWQRQIGPAQFAAQQERLSNVDIISGQREDVRLGQAGERIEISKAAQKLSEWRAQHPNMQLKTREDGMIVGISPLDPTDVVESGVQSGDLSDQEKEDARVEAAAVAETGRVSRAATVIGERKTAAGLRTGQRQEAATLQEERLRSRPSKPGVLTESARTTRRLSAAEELKNRDPNGLGKWVTIDGRKVEVAEPGKVKAWWPDSKGPTPEEHQKIMSILYPNGEPITETSVNRDPGGIR